MSHFLKSINEETHLVPYVRPSYLEIDRRFPIKRFIKTETQFGEQVVVDCSEFKKPLPQRFTEKFSEKVIQTLNNLLKQGKNIFMVSEGIVGRTTNIKFVEQTEE
jgi:hypothetical protein